MDVPYIDLVAQHEPLKEEILEAVEEVLDHGWFILGEEVTRFEQKIADYLDVPHVIGVSSGTDALELAMRARGIGEGDEVITVSHTWISGVSAIDLVGADPVFVDVDPESMLMDPAELEGALTDRTEAVMPVHINGFPCELDPIRDFCDTHDLTLIEDCAQALGTEYGGQKVGTTDIGCFSLHPLKVLSACGDGGLIAVQDDSEAERLRQLRNNGRKSRDVFPYASDNSRLDTLQAAILLVKFGHLEDWIEGRRSIAAAYREAFDGVVELPPAEPEGNRSVYSMFVIRHPRRDELEERLIDRGIDVKVHYPFAVHEQEPFQAYAPAELPATDEVVSQILSLPVYPEMTDAQRDAVIEAVIEEVEDMES
jgi:dTDP-4-amino-4,6-dideoxygalactose transaminase